MQQRMQHMINLQNEEMVLSSQEVLPDYSLGTAARPRQSTSSSRASSSRGDPPESTVPITDHKNATTAAGLPSSVHGSEQSSASSIPLGRTSMSRSGAGLASLHNLHQESSLSDGGGGSNNNNYSDRSSGPSDILDDDGVGKGTLYFNSEILGSAATAATQSVLSDQSARQQMQQQQQQQQHFLPNTEDQRLTQGMEGHSNRGASYGAVGMPPPPPPPFPSSTLPENPNQLPSHQKQHPNPQHYTYPPGPGYPAQPPQGPASGYPDGAGSTSGSSFRRAAGMCCSCIWKIIYMCFCCCSTDAIEEQQLHRSFCYGAIDGMLTGSGIVAAFCGMDVLAPTSTLAVRSFVVAFSAAACFADSLCMALGHVWTTHVMVTASARERSEQRVAMEENKAGLKGKLVDMLLERGMLKIDAMSLADTLEGYPDMFVDALVGDALIAGGVSGTKLESSPTLGGRRRSSNGGSGSRTSSGHHHTPWGGANQMVDQEAGGNGNFLLWKFPSYNQHMAELENEDLDPEVAFVGTAMTESRREGLFMMMGFSLFAVVPSLLYLAIPMMVDQHHHEVAKSSAIGIKSTSSSGGSMSASTMMVTSAAIIMWCLGVWKSRFLDSNWMLFGIETVVVLLFCIMAAYVLGAVLAALIPEIDAAIINTRGSSSSSEKESL